LPRRPTAVRFFLAAALTLVAVVGLGVVAVTSYATATGMADRAMQVRQEIDAWLNLLIDAETGARGYVGAGERSFLEPYQEASARERQQAMLVRTLIASEGGPLTDVEAADREASA